MKILWVVVFLTALACTVTQGKPKGQPGKNKNRPNFIFILTDDQGYGDIGYYNEEVLTPNLDALAAGGLRLDNYYSQSICSPSRGALLTGMYPYKIGLQHNILFPLMNDCAPGDIPMISEKLKELGYRTHLVGKWHLGFCNVDCTPPKRGFDTFNGFYNGYIDHYTNMISGGYDYRNGAKVDISTNGTHSTNAIRDKVLEQIETYDGTPFYTYVSFAAPHIPLQADEHYIEMYKHIESPDRRTFLAMVTQLDDAVGTIVQSLRDHQLEDNTYIIFVSDNGAELPGGYNGPQRGTKSTMFQGGIHVPAFVYSPLLGKEVKGSKSKELFHVTDWFPTMLSLAGGKLDPSLNGVDQSSLFKNEKAQSGRDHIILQIDSQNPPLFGRAAILKGHHKLILGYPGVFDGWQDMGNVYVNDGSMPSSEPVVAYAFDFAALARQAMASDGLVQLFNLKDDPNEKRNIAPDHPKLVEELKEMLAHARDEEREPKDAHADPHGNSANFGGVWSPGWC